MANRRGSRPAFDQNQSRLRIADLCALYAPFNRQLRDLLAAERTSCEGAACDGFLWTGDCAA